MTALTFAGVLLFAQLGRWQWHRAVEKRGLAAAFIAGTAAAPSELGPRSTATLPRYAPLQVRGTYDPSHQFLLDNMSHSGQTGYEVLTPFRLEDGRLLLVNRGWVALPDARRDTLPDIAIPDAGATRIGGRVDALPVTGLDTGRVPPSGDTSWPKRTSFPTAVQLSISLGQAVEPQQLLLGENEPRGFARDWHSAGAGLGPERHLGYAVQWWGLGALCLFLYVFMNLERRAS